MPPIVQKRLLGKEDCDFDFNGTGETRTTIDGSGNSIEVSKLNDSHIPILLALRSEVGGATEINAALTYLASGLNGIGSATLTEEGLIEIADSAEMLALADPDRAVTPAGLSVLDPSETQRGLPRAATQAEVTAGTLGNVFVPPSKLPVFKSAPSKFLTISGTLTINDSANESSAGYLTSNEIVSGDYYVLCFGGGGGGRVLNRAPSGSGGGVSYGILTINSSTAYTIGAGGSGGVSPSNGGDTTIGVVTGGGGLAGSNDDFEAIAGGTGNFLIGQAGSGNLGVGGGPSGGASATSSNGTNGGLASGGGGSESGTAGDGGDGYILLYKFS